LPQPVGSPAHPALHHHKAIISPSSVQAQPFHKQADAVETVVAPPTVFCAEVGQRIAKVDCDDYAAQAQSAKDGLAAFNAPSPMTRGQGVTLQLAMSFKPPANAQAQTPAQVIAALPGTPVNFTPKVGRHMSAELSGAGFDISPSGPQTMDLGDGVTTWEWKVTAKEEGAKTLVLKTVVNGVDAKGDLVALQSTVKDVPITVKVGAWQTALDLLSGLPAYLNQIKLVLLALTGVVGAALGLWAALHGRRRSGRTRMPKSPPAKG
jgi:hypothetical protein